MRTLQIRIAAILAAAITLLSCTNGKPALVKREALEASEQENAMLRSSLQEAQENFARQNKELGSILAGLAAISRETSSIQLNVETGASQRTQAEQAQRNLESLKARINRLEKEANQARKANKELALAVSTIKELRTTVANQEKQITNLKAEIAAREQTIKTQKDTITQQGSLIAAQERALRNAVKDLAEQLYQAGTELEELADSGLLNVSGRRDKLNVSGYRKQIYGKALASYRKAAAQGHEGAKGRIATVEEKLSGLSL